MGVEESAETRNWKIRDETGDVDHRRPGCRTKMELRVISFPEKRVQYSRSRESSTSEDETTLSPDVDEKIFLKHSRRKESTCSDASSTNSGDSGKNSSSSDTDCESLPSEVEYDDIIDRMVKLKFSLNSENTEERGSIERSRKTSEVTSVDSSNGNELDEDEQETESNGETDDGNENYEKAEKKIKEVSNAEEKKDDDDEEENDDDLVERGPSKSPFSHHYHNEKPYYTPNLIHNARHVPQNEPYSSEIDEILSNRQFKEKLDQCLDQLWNNENSNWNQFNEKEQIRRDVCDTKDQWCPEIKQKPETANVNIPFDNSGKMPSIPISSDSDQLEASLMTILANGAFQEAQVVSDPFNSQNPSPGAASLEHYPNSPASSGNNFASSCSHSRGSSRAHSPGSSANIGSPLSQIAMGSPLSYHQTLRNFRTGPSFSPSGSSNYSFGDTPSPLNYQYGVEPMIEENLNSHFADLPTCAPNYPSETTIMNSEDTIRTIDSSELLFLDELIGDDNSMTNEQKVPQLEKKNDFSSDLVKTNYQGDRIETVYNRPIKQEINVDFQNSMDDGYRNIYSDPYWENTQNVYPNDSFNSLQGQVNLQNSLGNTIQPFCSDSSQPLIDGKSLISGSVAPISPSLAPPTCDSQVNEAQANTFNSQSHQKVEAPKSTFNEFQIPETVSSYQKNRIRRISEQHVAPWPALNMPATKASERLKAEVDSHEVEKAMKCLLKKSTEELNVSDSDGDTMLMCLVGNPLELEKKKAYLAPLVERLGNVALTMSNNRGEDALYLAAMNCPQMAYVTGYLAAIMIQREIDVSRRLYHNRGDTLVHAIAAKGDSHVEVLAELLALKTIDGKPIFDLSQCNYDGRTPLHLAVESHSSSDAGVSCLATTQLLLENGADQKIRETKGGDSALHIAVSLSCDPTLVKMLLKYNGDWIVNLPNYSYNTPVHLACALSKSVPIEKQIKVCEYLILAGGQTNVVNAEGKTPLSLALTERKDIIKSVFHRKL